MSPTSCVLLALIAAVAVDGTTSSDCTNVSCSGDSKPVCGSDGKTYENECELKTAQCLNPELTINRNGPCDNNNDEECSHLACPALWSPVCGSDGRTYSNRCVLNAARRCKNPTLTEKHPGSCYSTSDRRALNRFECNPNMKGGRCTKEYNPVCGSDGKTYPNPCMLCAAMYEGNDKLKVIYEGRCIEILSEDKSYLNPGCTEGVLKIQCTQDEFPLCGTDGKTYRNACNYCKGLYALKEEGKNLNVKHLGKCEKKVFDDETPKFNELQCDEDVKYCSQEYNPVCANDGTTLPNACVFCLYKVSREKNGVRVFVKHDGECSPEEYCPLTSVFGACPYTFFPLCATDGNTYPNLCVMCSEMYKQKENGAPDFVLRKAHDGVCGIEPPMYYEAEFCTENMKNQVCTNEYSPICASDGKTYQNKCQFCQAMYKQKESGQGELGVRIEGECPENFKCTDQSLHGECSNTYTPVCGSDGVTYNNDCLRCAEMYRRQKAGENIFIYVKYRGKCPK